MDSGGANSGGLSRRVGLLSAGFLIVANMVGTGIFTTSGYIMQMLADPMLMLGAWLLGGVIALAGALSYAELGARLPRAGGDYAFLNESFGPLWAFLSGWISLVVGFSAPIAASAMAAAAYLLQAWPGGAGVVWWRGGLVTISPESLLALGFIAALTLVHTRRLAVGLGVQNLLTALKLLLLVVLVVAGLALWPAAGVWQAQAASPPAGHLAGSLALSLIFIFFAYSGFNAAAYLGEEIERPQRNLPLALLLGTGLVVLLYLLINLAYLAALGPAGMLGVKEIGALAAKVLFGPRAGGLFSLAVSFCLLSNIGAMILAGSRVYFAMARDGVFFGALARVPPHSRVPINAVLLQSLIAAVLVLTASFQALLFYIGFTLSLFAALTVAGLLLLRRRQPQAPPFRVPGYPFTPLAFVAVNLGIAGFSLWEEPLRGLPAGLTILAGLVFYFLHRRLRRPGRPV
ncbi:MAG: amino acid permease [Desulfarculus sp.]|nr:MAG: amino acid permease [Desulfarculus sp.]